MSASRWSLPHRTALRFGIVYLGLYELPLFAKRFVPGVWRNTTESIGAIEPIVRGFGHALGVHGSLAMEHPCGGDTPFEWVRLLFLVLIATVATVLWSALDRNRAGYPVLLDVLRTFVRYGLAFTMLHYAIVKPLQFTPPRLLKLLEPYGEASPMGLLWTFMGFSRPYTFATGIIEATGAVLLFWRRTTLLGALLLVGALTNVLLLNLSYDVPVKLYSAHLLLMALFLCSKDGGHLLRLLLGLAARNPQPLAEVQRPWPSIPARAWVKGAVIVGTTVLTTYVLWSGTTYGFWSGRPLLPPRSGLYGAWRIESCEPFKASPMAWHHLMIDEWNGARVEHMDDSHSWFELDVDTKTVSFRPDDPRDARVTLGYSRPADAELVLEGTLDGESVTMHLRRRERPFLLLSRGFQFVQESGLNQ